MAPERLREPFVSRTVKYDVYSFGILFWELLTGQKPFEEGKNKDVMHLVKLDAQYNPLNRIPLNYITRLFE